MNDKILKCVVSIVAAISLLLLMQTSAYSIVAVAIIVCFLAILFYLLVKMILTAASAERMKRVIKFDFYPMTSVLRNTKENWDAMEQAIKFIKEEMFQKKPYALAFALTIFITTLTVKVKFLDLSDSHNWILISAIFFAITGFLYLLNILIEIERSLKMKTQNWRR
ncbi:hypothetical protein HY988_05935 [Candidatus Micrarchaeota archaeon]|nr:hypothetical protein [Candidatus Micrarchaeota archaeon]